MNNDAVIDFSSNYYMTGIVFCFERTSLKDILTVEHFNDF